MKLNIPFIYFLLSPIFVILIFISCRKTDEIVSKKIAVNKEERFFTGHRSSDAEENLLVNYIKQQEQQLHFIKKTVDQIGYPRWNKTIVVKPVSSGIVGESGSENNSSTLYYIPFVRDSQHYVNASMVIAASATDTSFWYYCDWQYRLLNNTDNTIDEAEQMAYFFMKLDNSVFGYKKFSIKDTSLFSNGDDIAASVQFDTVPPNFNESYSVFSCQNVLITYQIPCNLRQVKNTDPTVVSRIRGPVCFTTVWLYLCFPEGENIPGGGGGGGNGSGGSGTPPDCGSPQGRGIAARGNLPCEEEPGWEPEPIFPIEDPYDPCELLKTKNNDTAYKRKLDTLKTKTSLKVETGFGETKTGVFTALQPGASTNNSDNLNAPVDSSTVGFSHTHLDDYEVLVDDGAFSQQTLLKKPIRIFSPKDLSQLMLLAHRNRFSGDYSPYYVTMVATNGTYTLKFTGGNADIRLDFASQQWKNHFEESFKRLEDKRDSKLEEFFLKYLTNTMQVTGVSLYKINGNGTVEEKKLSSIGSVLTIPCP